MNGTLFCIGVGPGDPELLTRKAVRLLERCPVWAAPKTSGGRSVALSIAAQAVNPGARRMLPLSFPMTRDPEKQDESYRRAAEALCACLAGGQDAALLTIGGRVDLFDGGPCARARRTARLSGGNLRGGAELFGRRGGTASAFNAAPGAAARFAGGPPGPCGAFAFPGHEGAFKGGQPAAGTQGAVKGSGPSGKDARRARLRHADAAAVAQRGRSAGCARLFFDADYPGRPRVNLQTGRRHTRWCILWARAAARRI